jgi:polyhydroxyalkanoate synthesis regulator protein
MLKLIKRYSNRKLYDTQNSCYITLEEVLQSAQSGLDILIIDNVTRADITAITLAKAMGQCSDLGQHVSSSLIKLAKELN